MTKNATKAAGKAKTITGAAALALAAGNTVAAVGNEAIAPPTGNSETIVNQAPTASTTTVAAAAPAGDTKAAKARKVFAEVYPDGKNTTFQRKDIIAKLESEAGLTKNGAATYLQNYKDKQGITVKRVPATA